MEWTFDGSGCVRMPLKDFFAVGRGGSFNTRSLLVGTDANGLLYSWFPMPFRKSAVLRFRHFGSGNSQIPIQWTVRRSNAPPSPDSLRFGATLLQAGPTIPGTDADLLQLRGRGHWVGLFADMSGEGGPSRQYLEGDEHVFLDGGSHPEWYGTGVEDFYNGGFYFDSGPFGRALHGSPYHILPANNGNEDVTSAYRLMVSDPVSFEHSLRAGLERGPTGTMPMRLRTVAWYYHEPQASLAVSDVLDLSAAGSRSLHGHSFSGASTMASLTSWYEGGPPVPASGQILQYTVGSETFSLFSTPGDSSFRIRRTLDASQAGQMADVYVQGAYAGTFAYVDANMDHSWRETSLALPETALPDVDGRLHVEIRTAEDVYAQGAQTHVYSASRYELLSGPETCRALLSAPRVRFSQRRIRFRSLVDAGDVPPGAGSPTERFLVQLQRDDAALELAVPSDDGGWLQRGSSARTRYRWRGNSDGLRTVKVLQRTRSRLWVVVATVKDAGESAALLAGSGDIELRLFLGDLCLEAGEF